MTKPLPILVCAALLMASIGCVHKTAPRAAAPPVADNSYLDLAPGGRLRIVVPLLKSGANTSGYRVETQSAQQDGNTITVSASNLAGYEVSYYSIEAASRGRVRLKFTSADITKDGETIQDTQAPALPFELPMTPRHIRLIYLVRISQSDHNMAIVASKDFDALNTFTKQIEIHPDVCKTDDTIFCSWVPAGIAVRPESIPPIKP